MNDPTACPDPTDRPHPTGATTVAKTVPVPVRVPVPDRRRRGRLVTAGVGLVGLAASLMPGASASAAPSSDRAPTDRPVVAPVDTRTDPVVEVLNLECRGLPDREAVGCAWQAPTDPRAVGVRLVRVAVGQGAGRVTVFRSGDLSVTHATDERVRPGVRYAYRLIALDAGGRIVGRSRAAVAGVPADPGRPDVEVLRLECEQRAVAQVGCRWSAPTADGARVLTLWRSVDGAARERVVSFRAPFATSYVDQVPDTAQRVIYAVVVENGAGRIVARSRPDGVVIRRPDIRRHDVVRDIGEPIVDDAADRADRTGLAR
ncbi:MAG: hypothetical protein AAFP84_05160 [Actinomycetota bacterium]